MSLISLNLAKGPAEELSEAIAEALRAFGPSVSSVTFHYLEVKMKVRRDELYRNPEALIKVLREIFGPLSSFIENQIAQSIAVKLGLRESPPLTQLLASLSKGVGLSAEVVVEHALSGRMLDVAHRIAARLEQLGSRVVELRLEKGAAKVKAEGGSLFTTDLSKYFKEVEVDLREEGGVVKASMKVGLPGALLSGKELSRLKREAEEILESCAQLG